MIEASPETGLPAGTVTLVFTDIEGSTNLLQTLGDRYPQALADHHRLLREAFARHDAFDPVSRDVVSGSTRAERPPDRKTDGNAPKSRGLWSGSDRERGCPYHRTRNRGTRFRLPHVRC